MSKFSTLLITRKKTSGFHSIERLIVSLSKGLLRKKIKNEVINLPRANNGFRNKLLNIIYVIKINKNKNEILHFFGDCLYAASFAPLKAKIIITFHDLNFFECENKIKKFFLFVFSIYLPSIRANKIHCISSKTAMDLFRILPSTEKKISVIPNIFTHVKENNKKNNISNIHNFLFLGSKPNKNLKRTILALNSVAKYKKINLTLVAIRNKYVDNCLKYAKFSFEVLSDISDKKLCEVYNNTHFLLFPSLSEGFGLPILEAQSLGIPLITSNLAPMSSVCGLPEICVNPLSIEDIKKKILEIMESPELIQKSIRHGLLNYRTYSEEEIIPRFRNLYLELSRL